LVLVLRHEFTVTLVRSVAKDLPCSQVKMLAYYVR
jgi:ATP phosphoribosyltransferase regulatory subunit HisZ